MDYLVQLVKDIIHMNTLAQYISASVVILVAIIIRFIVCSIVYKRLHNWAEKDQTIFEGQTLPPVKRPLGWIIILIGLYIATGFLDFHPKEAIALKIDKFFQAFFTTLISICVAWSTVRFVDVLSLYLKRKADKTEGRLDDQLVPLVSKSLKIFTWVIVVAFIVQNLGYSIAGIVAGLGIGGLAVAFAAKDTLANLFGSVTIFLDGPFHVGDWIKVNDIEGTVETIGFRSTVIRTFYKTEVSVPNQVIGTGVVENYSRMQRRRISTTLSFTYETSADQMEKAVEAIKTVLKDTEGVFQDFHLVNFTEFGASSLDVMLYYFTETTDWKTYLDVRERVNLNIMRAMEKIGVEFAFKSVSVYLRSAEGDKIPQVKVIS